jgi:hypothetical protein
MTTLHNWTKEKHDGGVLGSFTFWRCPVCGASGGGFIEGRPRRCFLAGPVIALPKDCDAARVTIREYLDDKILKLSQMGPKGISPHYASLLHDMIVWTPEATDLTPFVAMVARIERSHDRPDLMDVREELQQAGFLAVPREVSEALREVTGL